MKTAENKKNYNMKFALKMLFWMAVGGVLGFAVVWFGTQTKLVGRFFEDLALFVQNLMIPMTAVITAGGIIIGEVILKKMKAMTEKILHAEDEECDELEYQEERIASFGLNISNLAMALSILVVSMGYSGKYLGNSDKNAMNFMVAIIIFVICFFYEGIWQMRYVKVIQLSRPEFNDTDPSSRKFQKQWLERCDEAEKEQIYESSYHTYLFLAKALPIAMVFAMLANLLYDTGVFAVVLLALIWVASTVYYTHSCIAYRKKKIIRK